MFSMKKSKLFAFCLILLPLAVLNSCVSVPRNEANETIVIPFTMEGDNRMVIYAEVNGVEGRFMWDTGSFDIHTFTPLDNLTPLPQNLNPTSSRRYFIENGVVINGQTIRSKSIINYIPSHTHSQWEWIIPYLKEEGFDGILGIAMFNGYWVEVSFSTSYIILHRTRPRGFTDFAPARTTFRSLIYFQGRIFVEGTINGVPIDFLLDTGSPLAFHFPHSVRESLGIDVYRKMLFQDNDVYYEIRTSTISLMGDVFYDKTITIDSMNEDFGYVLLGVEFLQRYDLLFDMRTVRERTRLYYRQRSFVPNMEKADTEFSCHGIFINISEPFGLRLESQEEGLWVSAVTSPGFAHDELGLMPGMWITHINGQRITGDDRTQLYEFLAYLKDGGAGELTVWENNESRVITRQHQTEKGEVHE